MRGIPGDCYSLSRFVKAAYLNANYPQKESETENVVRMFRSLEGVVMIEGASRMGDGKFEKTIYTGCFSARTGNSLLRDVWESVDSLREPDGCRGREPR